MLNDPITLKFDNDTIDLEFTRVDAGRYSGEYVRVGPDNERTLTIKHTVPKTPGAEESHLIRLDDKFFVDGEHDRTQQVWVVMKTIDGKQNTTTLLQHLNTLVSMITSGDIALVANRES